MVPHITDSRIRVTLSAFRTIFAHRSPHFSLGGGVGERGGVGGIWHLRYRIVHTVWEIHSLPNVQTPHALNLTFKSDNFSKTTERDRKTISAHPPYHLTGTIETIHTSQTVFDSTKNFIEGKPKLLINDTKIHITDNVADYAKH